ncbi:Similar to hypothetical protein [Tuber melanosporum Mel28]; acc. no. XP_002840912 [Pyronema omphalodes CBS 100304]|uniref:Uncharacterized protein n=1 Tax=Pyronema omphalodes (strain CBS 100304) TaxID=1076935 RepID=U4LPX1_PYROM|nr:Similar to hypothetical protein [Tuber melanosporum Mel28]; acc. no. XP_002840912 [Pyronema omphalodes CBS 100304]
MASVTRLRPFLRTSAALPRFSNPQFTASFHVYSAARREIRWLPRILQPSAYFKSSGITGAQGAKEKKGWNPATFFIVRYKSTTASPKAIQQLKLKRDYAEFERKADTKIALLKEVLEALGRGEEVDVEKVLGAGDEKEEKAWEEVIKELEEDDVLWKARQLQREQAAAAAEAQEAATQRKRRQAKSAADYNFV